MKLKNNYDSFDSAVGSVTFVLLQYVFLRLYAFLPVSIRASWFSIVASILLEGLFLLSAYLTAKMSRTNFIKASYADRKVTKNGVIISVIISIMMLVFASPLTSLFSMILEKIGYKSSLGGITVNNFFIYLVYVVSICIVPAVTEESLFRGCIVGGLKEKNKHLAVLLGATIFMLMHGGPDQTVHQFIMGVVVGYIFILTENIWYPIIIHFTNNFIAITLSYILSGTQAAEEAEATVVTGSQIGLAAVRAVVMGAAGAFIIYYLIKELVKTKKIAESTSHDIVITTIDENAKTAEQSKTSETATEDQLTPEKIESVKRPKWLKIALFAVSIGYLTFEWILTLLIGLGVL